MWTNDNIATISQNTHMFTQQPAMHVSTESAVDIKHNVWISTVLSSCIKVLRLRQCCNVAASTN